MRRPVETAKPGHFDGDDAGDELATQERQIRVRRVEHSSGDGRIRTNGHEGGDGAHGAAPERDLFDSEGREFSVAKKRNDSSQIALLIPTQSDKIAGRETRANEIDGDNTDAVRQQQGHDINGVQSTSAIAVAVNHNVARRRFRQIRGSKEAALDSPSLDRCSSGCFALATKYRRRLRRCRCRCRWFDC